MLNKLFKIAAAVASVKDDSRLFRVGCSAIRSDNVIVSASNAPVMLGYTGSFIRKSFPPAHAEIRCSRKINKNSIVFVARIRKDNQQYAMARPCHNCMGVLLSKSVNKIYYTIDHETYGIICVKNKHIVSEKINYFR
ncbi:MAG: hypothetical protein ACOYLO_00540 [Ferruginibacter sp.]